MKDPILPPSGPAARSVPAHPVPAALPTDKALLLRVIPMPADCNANGDIFGGWVMSQVDLAGAVLPYQRANGRVATVAINEFVFEHPVQVGDRLSIYGAISRTGRTSVTVGVEVFAEPLCAQGHFVKVARGTLTYVAIDDQGRPRPLPAE